MPKTVTIEIPDPLIGHGEPMRRVVLREPTFSEFLDLGEPYFIAQTPDGAPLLIENGEAIRAYLQVCVVEPRDTLALEQGGFHLAREIKAALLGFFRPAAKASEGSSTSPTTSSSPASGNSQPTASAA